MADDLSKWRTDRWIRYTDAEEIGAQNNIYVSGGRAESITVGMSVRYAGTAAPLEIVVSNMSLDDAENFAALILYEVKRAKGEL